MRPQTETTKRAAGRGRRRDPNAEPEILVPLTVILVVMTAFLVVLTALLVHNSLAIAGAIILAIAFLTIVLWWFARRIFNDDRRIQKETANIAHKIEAGPGGVAVLLLQGKGSTQSRKELEHSR